ncbi:InlB B-repeat-containing protein [Fibrobacter succinogenes]|uniref:InlB B-repeat-containing protein n=1 Tax=Fibrobacter succinogenes TaxID=833 RepID=UPI0015668ACE|nr:InlB B-repeat-containing protein [Fibrobacter succinogenes]
MQKSAISIMKKMAVLLLTAGIGLSMAGWDGKSKEKPETTVIDQKTFYLIKNEANLAWFADTVNRTAGKSMLNAKLTAPMNMRHKLFVPIAAGKGDTQFGGIFDGDGYTISDLYIDAAKIGEIENPNCEKEKAKCNAQNVAFIAVLGGGTVKNLVLENVDITASTNAGDILSKEQPITVGSVVAWQTSGTIEACFATGNIQTSGKGNVVGGIVGNMKGGTAKNNLSTVNIHVSGDESYAGGTVGVIRGNVTLQSNAYDGSSIVNNGDGSIGGVIGHLENGTATLSHCYYDTDIADDGIGFTTKDTTKVELKGSTSGEKNLNSATVVCGLNNGNLAEGSCPEGIWNQGAKHISLNKASLNENGKIVYQITFDANKGVFSKSAKTSKLLEAGETITATEITEPLRGDTVFAGWALTADAEAPAADLGVAAKATTVYAVWKKMFAITFNANGGAFLNEAGETIIGNASKIVAENAEINMEGIRIGTTYGVDETTFYFVGWATEADAEEPLESLGTATGNATFYALWREEVTYTVTFDAGIGGYSIAFVKEDGKAVKPDDPKAEGYTFGGWFNGETAYDFDEVVTKDLTLTSQWKPVEYKITYELGEGKNHKDNPATYTVETATIALGAPTKEGYSFDGWFYDNKYTDRATQITKGSTGDMTLYAKWEIETFTVTYMAGRYGKGIVASDLKEYGFEINLSKKTYTREGYKQTGWSTTDGGKLAYKLGEKYDKNEGLSLFPYWEEDPDAIRHSTVAAGPKFGAVAHGRTLEIYGIAPGTSLTVFDMNGRAIHRTLSTSASSSVTIAKPGIYMVKAGNNVARVGIR